MKLGSFDVIVGMDWLSKHRAEIVCSEKFIRIPLQSGETLQVYGEKPSRGLKLMSCTQAQKYICKKYIAFLATIVEKKSDGKRIQDVPIVRKYPEVFPMIYPVFLPFVQLNFASISFPVQHP